MSVFKFLFLQFFTIILIPLLCEAQTPVVYSISFQDLKDHLGIPVDALVNVKVRAHNANGWSSASELNVDGATMEYKPLQVGTLTLDISQTTNDKIAFTWTELQNGVQTGGTGVVITKYNIYWLNAGNWDYLEFTTIPSYSKSSLSGQYQFKVSASNKFGEGELSTAATFKTGQSPSTPLAPTVTLSGIYVKIEFVSPAINNFAIDKYKILINDDQIESLTYCDGSNFVVMTQMYCMIPMELLRESPFQLGYGVEVYAQVSAHNQRGWSSSSFSSTSGPTIQTQPLQMSAPSQGALTSKNSIQISWLPVSSPSATGGSPITSYIVYWDQGTSGTTWTELFGKTSIFTGISYTISSGIITGYTYKFKIQAENIWGIGDFSIPKSIIAASAPSQMIAPTTLVDLLTGNVIVSWTAPSANGQTITAYVIYIVDGSGAPQLELSSCDGSLNSIVTNKQCSIPMTVLTGSSFSLLQGTLIQVAIQAINSIDISVTSGYNSDGAHIATVPLAPTTLSMGLLSSSTQIQLEWSALIGTDTGGSPITSYRVYWDNGANDGSQTLVFLDSLVTSYTVTGLTSGNTYQFKLQGKNIYGYGALQTVALSIKAQDVPGTMNSPSISLNYPQMKIDWSSVVPNTNGAAIDYYVVQIFNPVTFTFFIDPTYCNSLNPLILECEIPIATLISSYGYNYGDILKARVRAHNINGFGGYSILNILGDVLEGPPSYMNKPLKDSTTSTATALSLYWYTITSDSQIGASVILSYKLEFYNTVTPGWETVQDTISASASKSGLTAGTAYQFRLSAINTHGQGAYSTISTLTPSAIPDIVDIPVTTLQGTNVKITWTQPINNGAAISKYQVLIKQLNLAFSEETTYCDGSNSAIIGQLYCLVPMTVFTSSPYLQIEGKIAVAMVRAYNSNGWGSYSTANSIGALIMTIPSQMGQPIKDTLSSESQIQVKWDPLTSLNNGGSAITSYHLQWDSGTLGTTWSDVIGYSPSSTVTSFILTTSIIAGQSYQFKVRAKNIFGWGSYSAITTIKASTVPYQISSVVTSIDSSTGGVKIAWSQPASGSSTIDSYLIEISNYDGSLWPTPPTTYCDGSSSTVIANHYCIIPMSILTGSLYLLTFQTLVEVKVTAHNSLGYGTTSIVNTIGAKIRRIPDTMSIPLVSSYSDSQIVLTWLPLTSPNNGDSSITSYELYWDNGGATTPSILLINQLTTTYTINGGLTAGLTYQFMVRAYNVYGSGLFSTPFVPVTAYDIPSKMAIPSVDTFTTNVVISFTQPDYHGSMITSYQFWIKKSDDIFYDASSLCSEIQATIITQNYCTMLMSDVKTFTSLTVNTLIVVSTTATNSKGTSAKSEVNTIGSKIESIPLEITTLSYDPLTSTNSQIVLTWATPANGIKTGGISVGIIDYSIQYAVGIAGTMSNTVTTASNTLTVLLLTGGQTYQFQIAARNKYGLGPYQTTILNIVAGQPPEEAITPTTTITSIYVKIAWTAPASNYVAIDAYKILIRRFGNSYEEDTNYCDGSSSTVKTNLYCYIPMTVLIASPYNLQQGNIVNAKIQAHNSKGWSAVSSENPSGAAIQTVPHQMGVVVKNSLTSSSQIVFDWTQLASGLDGDSTIISYGIKWDSGTDGVTFVELVGETSDLIASQYAFSSNIVSGTTYKFKIRAKNKWGWGPYSTLTSILAGEGPATVPTVTTSIDATTGGVKIQWTSPSSNGAVITAYTIMIQDYNGDMQYDLSDCNGALSTVIANLYCIIPMSTLIGSTFQLIQGDLVVAQVKAINSIGSGSYSAINTIGAHILTIPLSENLVLGVTSKTETEITLSWTALTSTNTGDSAITSYNIYWDNGSGTSNFVSLMNSLVTSYTVTGLTQGTTYIFRIRAYNFYGPGLFSSSDLSVIASNVPQIMDTVITSTIGTTSIKMEWVEPDDNGASIDIYKIKIYNYGTGLYVIDTTNCDGSISGTITDKFCIFTIAYLMSTYSYPVGELVKFIASAHNINGWSDFSSVNTIGSIIQTVPQTMGDPYSGAATTKSQIDIQWDALSTTLQTGASPITSYELSWNQGTGTIEVLVGFLTPYTSTSLLKTLTLAQEGLDYEFFLRAQNAFGWGGSSQITTITPSSIPSIVSTVVTSVTGTNVLLKWTTPTNNGAAITKYKITILQNDGIYSEPSSAYCDGSSLSLITNTECYIPMSYLRSSPYSLNYLSYTKLIKVQVYAYNIRGYGPPSLVNTLGAKIEISPLQMAAPTRGSLTTSNSIQILWVPIDYVPDNGGSSIISYNLQWDAGSSGVSWYSLAGFSPYSLDLTYTLINNVVSGQSYLFRVRARNNHGWGTQSSTTSITAASSPNQVINVVTSIDVITGGVKISWSAPSNGGSFIKSYKIEVQKKGTTNWFETTYCDGTSSTIISNLYCIIPMSTLTSATYAYDFQDIVIVQVSAYNQFGYGLTSTVNTVGAAIRRIPAKMNKPTVQSKTDSEITIQWIALTSSSDTGDSSIISYDLLWDQGTGGSVTSHLIDDLITEYTVSGLVGDGLYTFEVRAKNIYGYGLLSNSLTVEASDIPEQINIDSIIASGTNLVLEFIPPDDHSDPIDSYEITYQYGSSTYTVIYVPP